MRASVAVLALLAAAPAGAVVRIDSLTGTATAQGSATVSAGVLACDGSDIDSAKSRFLSESCLQRKGPRECRIYDVYGGYTVYQPTAADPTLVLTLDLPDPERSTRPPESRQL